MDNAKSGGELRYPESARHSLFISVINPRISHERRKHVKRNIFVVFFHTNIPLRLNTKIR